MVTNGPLLTFTVNDREAGDEVRLPFSGNHRLRARVTLRSNLPVDSVQVVANGRVVARFASPDPATFDTTVVIPVTSSSWYLARAFSAQPRLPILDLYPFASTSPVYVTVGNAPTTCGQDAEYFLRWINLIGQRVRADTNWNTSAERRETLDLISRAHQEFIRRR